MIQSIRTQNVLWTKVGDFKAPSSTAQPIAGLEGFTISRFWHCNLLRMGRVNWIGLSLSGFLCKVPKRTVITAVFSQVSTVLSQSFWNTEAISAWTLASSATKDWNKLVGRMMRATKFKTLMMKSRSCGTDLEVTISHNKHLANFFLWEHLQSKFSHPESHTLGSIYIFGLWSLSIPQLWCLHQCLRPGACISNPAFFALRWGWSAIASDFGFVQDS